MDTSRDERLNGINDKISNLEKKLSTLREKKEQIEKEVRSTEEEQIVEALAKYDMFKVLNTNYTNSYRNEMFVDTEKSRDDWGSFPELHKLGWCIVAFRNTQSFQHKGKSVDGSRLWLKKFSAISTELQ